MKLLLTIILVFFSLNSRVVAEETSLIKVDDRSSEQAVPADFGIIDELVESDITPEQVYLLAEIGSGQVRKYKAWFVDHNEVVKFKIGHTIASPRRWEVGVPVKLQAEQSELSYSFFLADSESAFAATPVKKVSFEKVRDNTQVVSKLVAKVDLLKEELKKQITQIEETEAELNILRQKASSIAGIENIVGLKMELSQLEGYGSEFDSERKRLESLIAHGRNLPDPPGLAAIRKELGGQLREAAKLTAMADRLAARKRRTAISRLKSKIAAVKSARGVDPRILSRDVLKLRRKRRELENRLGKSNIPANQQEF